MGENTVFGGVAAQICGPRPSAGPPRRGGGGRSGSARAYRCEDGGENGSRGDDGASMGSATVAVADLGAEMGEKTIREGATAQMGVAERFLRAQRRVAGTRGTAPVSARECGLREGRDGERDGTAKGTGLRRGRDCEGDGTARTLECSYRFHLSCVLVFLC